MFCAGVFSSEYLEEKDDVYLGYISLCYMCKYILNVTHGVHVLQQCFTSVVIWVGVIMLKCNLRKGSPADLWDEYIQLPAIWSVRNIFIGVKY